MGAEIHNLGSLLGMFPYKDSRISEVFPMHVLLAL